MINYVHYSLVVTTQGPSYPPSEIMNADGDFIVIGRLNLQDNAGECIQKWGSAIVSKETLMPPFGQNLPYKIIKELDLKNLSQSDNSILYTLPLPLPCNNYPMDFAPEQQPVMKVSEGYPLHEAPIPDFREQDGRKVSNPIRLSDWVKAKGNLYVFLAQDKRAAKFEFNFNGLIPNSLYTVMALRKFDLDPINGPTRPGPLGVPNVFITDDKGCAQYQAMMPNPFPADENKNRIINVVVLWMSNEHV